jgi:hypothetical protein
MFLSCESNKESKQKIEISHKMMDENQFWSIIETTKTSSEDLEEFEENLSKTLFKLSANEIIEFYLREQKLRFDSYNSDLWCAAYIMNGGCSDDAFEYFRCWLIAQGKDVFYKALKNPDTLVELYSPEEEEYDFEGFMYLTSDSFEKKTGKDIDDYVDYEQFTSNEAHYPDFECNWEEENQDSMKKICPKLMKVAWN